MHPLTFVSHLLKSQTETQFQGRLPAPPFVYVSMQNELEGDCPIICHRNQLDYHRFFKSLLSFNYFANNHHDLMI